MSQTKVCPVCLARFSMFQVYGRRLNAQCPRCSALERHRVSWLYLKSKTTLFRKPTRLLHFAPEPFLQRRLMRRSNIIYTPAFYSSGVGIDIQELPFKNNSFDMIYCSHVLEHVPDDGKALHELFRVLSRGGLAVIMVPITERPATYEDPTITTAEGRLKAFGQHDHVRIYGRDFPQRVREAGFKLEIVYHHAAYTSQQQIMYGIRPEPIFVSRRV